VDVPAAERAGHCERGESHLCRGRNTFPTVSAVGCDGPEFNAESRHDGVLFQGCSARENDPAPPRGSSFIPIFGVALYLHHVLDRITFF
jgi:hypothetical protein